MVNGLIDVLSLRSRRKMQERIVSSEWRVAQHVSPRLPLPPALFATPYSPVSLWATTRARQLLRKALSPRPVDWDGCTLS
jgi:hypothetical protein